MLTRFAIACMALISAVDSASAQSYYMRVHLNGAADKQADPADPVDDHFYRWSQPIDVRGQCVAGYRTTTFKNQCYDQTAGVVVADAKCTATPPAPRTDVDQCILRCTNPQANKKPAVAGTPLGTANSAANAAALCNTHPAQTGICYRDTATNQVTFTYTTQQPIASTRAADTAVVCGAL